MIYLFHGENSFDSWNKLKATIGVRFLDIKIFDGESVKTADEIFNIGDSISMFGESSDVANIVIIKRLFQNSSKKFITQVVEHADKANFDLYIWETEQLGVTDLKVLPKNSIISLFDFPNLADLRNFITEIINSHKITASKPIIEMIITSNFKNKLQLKNELEKLCLLVKSEQRNEVTQKDLAVFTENEIENKIWDMTDAIIAKDKKKALKLLNILMKKNEDFPMIISALTNNFETIYLLKSNISNDKLTKEFKIHPFVIKKNSVKVAKFSLEQIKLLFSKLANLDYTIKQGKIDARLGLNLLISTIN